MPVKLYAHQAKAAQELANGKILWGEVGTGKSRTAMAYFITRVCGGVIGDFGSLQRAKDIYVITTAKKRNSLDWEIEAGRFGVGRERNASIGGVKLTVDSWNNLPKYTEVKDAFFIFDEQRLVGSGAWVKSFLQVAKHNEWILLSATPGDTWLDYIPVFVANGFYKNRTEFKIRHVIYNSYSKYPKVDRYVGVGTLVRHRRDVLVHMPYQKHTVRHSKIILVDHDKETFERVFKKRWHVYENRPLKNVSELFSVMRKVVNSDVSRLETLHTLLEKHPRLIVFYSFDYELEILRSLKSLSELRTEIFESTTLEEPEVLDKSLQDGLVGTIWEKGFDETKLLQSEEAHTPVPSSKKGLEWSSSTSNGTASFTLAEWNGHKHEPIPKTDRWVYLVQYSAGYEAWNCIETNAMVFYSLPYSYRQFHQAHGRIDRLNTPFTDLYYYSLVSNAWIDKEIKKALKSKKSFNERTFTHSNTHSGE